MVGVVLLVVVVAALATVLVLERYFYIAEYLFFVRYPILVGLVLMSLPWAAPAVAPTSLSNIFVLDAWGAAFVAYFALLAASTVVFAGRTIWLSVPWRCKLGFRRGEPAWVGLRSGGPGGLAKPHPRREWFILTSISFAFTLAIAAPIIRAAIVRLDEHAAQSEAVTWASLAVGVTALFHYLIYGLTAALAKKLPASPPPSPGGEPEDKLKLWIYQRMPARLKLIHLMAFVFFAITAGCYIVLGLFTGPTDPRGVPVLAYLLIVLMLLAWVLSLISFAFDRSRLPGVAVTVLLLVLLQSLAPGSNEFRVVARAASLPKASESIHTRWVRAGQGPLVAVAASGGGITASYWTGIVLNGLSWSVEDIGERIAVISSVSGGGVATMMYADAFDPTGFPKGLKLQSLIDRAGEPSLRAVGWGIAYLDLWRTIPWMPLGVLDRGWALEERWSEHLSSPDATLGAWADGVRAGWRPLHIFNATIQESGQRLLLAPATFEVPDTAPPRPRMRMGMDEYLPRGDVRLVTAARLSATFPFVSPQARPQRRPGDKAPGLHCADGGYFDNSGLYTAMEVLSDYLDARGREPHPDRIAIVEIRAANAVNEAANTEKTASRGGLINLFKGPLETLYNARVATQIDRNAAAFNLVQRTWEKDHAVRVERFVFHLSERLPLTWDLTSGEREFIRAHWPLLPLPKDFEKHKGVLAAREHNEKEIDRLRKFVLGEGAGPAPPDPAIEGLEQMREQRALPKDARQQRP